MLLWNIEEGQGKVVNYEALWQVLADLVTELKKSGESIPPYVMKDLRSAKTTIQILKVNRDNPDHISRTEEFLRSVESYVMYATEKRFEPSKIDEWMERLRNAWQEPEEAIPRPGGFVTGVPRDKHWVRMKISPDLPERRIKAVTHELGISYQLRENGFALVYGEKGKIRNFVRRMAEFSQDQS